MYPNLGSDRAASALYRGAVDDTIGIPLHRFTVKDLHFVRARATCVLLHPEARGLPSYVGPCSERFRSPRRALSWLLTMSPRAACGRSSATPIA